MKYHETDYKFIQDHGGPANLARLLGYQNPQGTRRVFQWQKRGIPSKVKIEHPSIFLKNMGELLSSKKD